MALAEINAALDAVKPSKPITVDDCVQLAEYIRPLCSGLKLDVYFTKSDGAIHVKVYSPQGLLVLERDLVAA